ncbi:ABC transporter permease subunit [Roseibium salinum]|nr:ABC transporter permease subunit [Roseibium salinum]
MLARKKPSPVLTGYRLYVVAFFIFLAAPLVSAGVFAFNDSLFPALPWQGFTLDWFFSDTEPKLGMFHDRRLFAGALLFLRDRRLRLASVGFRRHHQRFPVRARRVSGQELLLHHDGGPPLVIPGVILGISILVLASDTANYMENRFDLELEFLRPGILLVVLGQFSFITTITSLVITARLKKFDASMEEAAFNLGATRARVLRTITLPFLRPAMIAAGIVAFLVSFENFNTTLFLVGSEAPLTITMYDRMAKVGSTPVLNAVSFVLMVGSGLLALLSVLIQRDKSAQ